MTIKDRGPNQTDARFRIEGQVQFEEQDGKEEDLGVKVLVADRFGEPLGDADVDSEGRFSVALRLAKPTDVQLFIGPGLNAADVRQTSSFSQRYSIKDWVATENGAVIRATPVVPQSLWWPWRPVRICVTGHVRKIDDHEGQVDICPVPFVKIEIFDVDREGCFWPPIRNWWDVLIDRPVIRIPDLLKPRRFPVKPFPVPDPAPDLRLDLGTPGRMASLNPQPLPPRAGSLTSFSDVDRHAVNAVPAPVAFEAVQRVGEARLLDTSIASRLDRLTLTSTVAPWLILPRCFYSRELLCETYTDCDGYFRCCFRWWPIHFRNGRLRFDSRPDIIVRLTQIINGVQTVIYMDPYTSTRWNVTNTHLDLYLDNEDVRCGQGCKPPPTGTPVFFTRIGHDEVYQINQASGLYSDTVLSQMAYGRGLHLFALFGDALASGAPARYYRLSYKKQGQADSAFKFVDADLSDTRVDKSTYLSSDHKLGPYPVNGTNALYEVRNRTAYYWYNPDWIGYWNTVPVEAGSDTYVLRLELFDENGVYLDSASGQVDYRDGTVAPPATLPAVADHCDLVITIDNQPAELDLDIPAVLNDCGVIPWQPALALNFNVSVTQPSNRLYTWALDYTKGVSPTVTSLLPSPAFSNSGALSPVNTSVSGAPLLAGLSSTCAFAVKLSAYAHIRNGYGLVYYSEIIIALAIEKCVPCPECGPIAIL
ncbi:hypothetical protein [Massilia sp. CCM 8734]|uniref:hypothetical protein n=1 Tax=Massilia sp. CCM 8734 TaxID=2609283 RepID=UPI001421F81F|nr:hypothetical protein [Massilia sp. CCM 8734]NHZ96098.1 hypothetical protein [Massilia sp. CCM 8734]